MFFVCLLVQKSRPVLIKPLFLQHPGYFLLSQLKGHSLDWSLATRMNEISSSKYHQSSCIFVEPPPPPAIVNLWSMTEFSLHSLRLSGGHERVKTGIYTPGLPAGGPRVWVPAGFQPILFRVRTTIRLHLRSKTEQRAEGGDLLNCFPFLTAMP